MSGVKQDLSGAKQDPGSSLATAALAKAFMGAFNCEAEGTTGTRLYMDEQDNVRLALETVLGAGLDEALKAQVEQVLAELETPEVRHYQASEEGEDYATVAKTMPVPAKDARAAAVIRALLGLLVTQQEAAPARARLPESR